MAYTKYSLTPANNTAAPPDGAPEGMLPSAVNDTMRDMMSQIRDVGDGVRDGTYTMTAPKITGGTITGVTLTGNTLTNPVITGATLTTSAFNGTVGATTASTGAFTTLSTSSTTTLSGLTASTALALDASKNVVSVTNTGTGNNVLSASPTLTGTIAGASLSLSSLTSGRVTYAGASGLLSDSANLQFTGTKLLIGTSTAAAPLTVITSVTSDNLVYLQNTNTSNGTSLGLTLAAGTNASDYSLKILNAAASSEFLRVTGAGNVGIGTSSPAFKTEIVGGATTVETTLFQIRSDAGGIGTGSTIAFANSTSTTAGSGRVELAAIRTTSSGGSFVIRTGDDSGTIQERMRITSAGNVGIGATSPVAKLQVKGSGTSGQVTASWILENSSSGTFGMDITGTAGASYARFLYGGGPSTGTNALTETMRIGLEGASVGVQQIKFAATQVPSADANTLDDYEEGTFTVTFTPSTSGTITLSGSYNTLSYTKVGRVVTITGEILVASSSVPVGTSVTIGGFPFAAGAGTSSSTGFSVTDLGTLTARVGRISTTNTTADMFITASTIGTNSNFMFGFSYIV